MRKILVINDDPALLDLVTSMLDAEENLAVMTATEGNAALQLARRYPPHLVLLDLTLPGRDGFSVLRLLKRDRRTVNAKVIILTGLDSDAARTSSEKLGADSFMTKPSSTVAMMEEISRLLRIEIFA